MGRAPKTPPLQPLPIPQMERDHLTRSSQLDRMTLGRVLASSQWVVLVSLTCASSPAAVSREQ